MKKSKDLGQKTSKGRSDQEKDLKKGKEHIRKNEPVAGKNTEAKAADITSGLPEPE
jgi:hypothetical protein